MHWGYQRGQRQAWGEKIASSELLPFRLGSWQFQMVSQDWELMAGWGESDLLFLPIWLVARCLFFLLQPRPQPSRCSWKTTSFPSQRGVYVPPWALLLSKVQPNSSKNSKGMAIRYPTMTGVKNNVMAAQCGAGASMRPAPVIVLSAVWF